MATKKHGNANNKNAVKSDSEVLDDVIRIRVNHNVKREMIKQSELDGYDSLSKWMLDKATQSPQQELINALLMAVKWIPTVDELSSKQGALTQYDNVEQLIEERNRIDCAISKFNTSNDYE